MLEISFRMKKWFNNHSMKLMTSVIPYSFIYNLQNHCKAIITNIFKSLHPLWTSLLFFMVYNSTNYSKLHINCLNLSETNYHSIGNVLKDL